MNHKWVYRVIYTGSFPPKAIDLSRSWINLILFRHWNETITHYFCKFLQEYLVPHPINSNPRIPCSYLSYPGYHDPLHTSLYQRGLKESLRAGINEECCCRYHFFDTKHLNEQPEKGRGRAEGNICAALYDTTDKVIFRSLKMNRFWWTTSLHFPSIEVHVYVYVCGSVYVYVYDVPSVCIPMNPPN